MSGYYSYKPLVSIDRPLVLLGVPGTDINAIARMVASFTGLPVLLVERKLMHAVEHHPDRWTAEGRHSERWDQELRLMRATFSAVRPVVGVHSHSALRLGALRWLNENARTVYVREPAEQVLARIEADIAKDPTRHWVLTGGDPLDPAKVIAELTRHQAVLDGCHHALDATGATPHGIAWGLLEPLGLSGD